MSILDQQTQRLLMDMETTRVTTRNKAFEEMLDLFDRVDDIQATFDRFGDNIQSSWKSMWRSAYTGTDLHFEKLQSSNANDNKTKFYEKVLKSICENANLRFDQIDKKTIFDDCINFLKDDAKARLLGQIFLKILDQQIFNSATNLGQINEKDWLKLISTLLDLFRIPEIADDVVSDAICNALDIGVSYFPIGVQLFPVLEHFNRFFEEKLRPKTHQQLVKVSKFIYFIHKDISFIQFFLKR